MSNGGGRTASGSGLRDGVASGWLPERSAGVGQCQIEYATIGVRTAGGKIWAYGSVVDNGTGDPTTICLFIE